MTVMNEHLIPFATAGESTVFYYKMKEDYYRYLAEFKSGNERKEAADQSMKAYEVEVNMKIKKAYYPPKVVERNPCLEYVKYIALPWFNEFTFDRKAEYGGTKTYKTFEELVADYEAEALHPGDVKPALAKALNKIFLSEIY